jgi:hypothetical protein
MRYEAYDALTWDLEAVRERRRRLELKMAVVRIFWRFLFWLIAAAVGYLVVAVSVARSGLPVAPVVSGLVSSLAGRWLLGHWHRDLFRRDDNLAAEERFYVLELRDFWRAPRLRVRGFYRGGEGAL